MDPAALSRSTIALAGAWIVLGVVLLRQRTAGAPTAHRDAWSLAGMGVQWLAFAIAVTDWPFGRPPTPILRASGVVLAYGSVWMAARAMRALGRHFSLTARTLEGHELVTSGPYASVRHPIYSAMLGLLVATTVVVGTPVSLAASIPIFVIGTLTRVRREERLLAAAFGDQWMEYAARTPALVPGLRSPRA
jgi:protein-S-isoprenylcysteine O-methyltransferase Ste14